MTFGITASSLWAYGNIETHKQELIVSYPLLKERLVNGNMRGKRYATPYQLIEVNSFEEIMDLVEKYHSIIIEKIEDTEGKSRYVIEIYDDWRE